MNDLAALTRAVIAAEDDDLPRLVLADYLEERDEPERAAFIRAQCEIAAGAPWDAAAVHALHHRPEWLHGRDFRHQLPATDPRFAEWLPDGPFHRGFGRSLVVRDLTAFLALADDLFELAPITELHLPTGPLSEWQRFVARPWLPRVRAVRFYGISTPIEPVRVLCDAPLAAGLEEIVFERSGSPALPELIAGIVRSRLGRQLRAMEFHVGYTDLDELIDACDAGPEPLKLRRLKFRTIGLTPEIVRRMLDRPILNHLTDLTVDYAPQLGNDGLRVLAKSPQVAGLQSLRLPWVQAGDAGAAVLASSGHLAGLKSLDLSHNVLGIGGIRRLGRSPHLAGLRSLRLRQTGMEARALQHIVEAPFWPNLVELDLSENRITDDGAAILAKAPPAPNLVALVVRNNPPLTLGAVDRLCTRYPGRVVS